MKVFDAINNIAATQTKPVTSHPRPFQTYYYESGRSSVTDWQRTSKSCTVHGALRAAFTRLFDGRSGHADVYDITGVRVAYITRHGSKITVVCV